MATRAASGTIPVVTSTCADSGRSASGEIASFASDGDGWIFDATSPVPAPLPLGETPNGLLNPGEGMEKADRARVTSEKGRYTPKGHYNEAKGWSSKTSRSHTLYTEGNHRMVNARLRGLPHEFLETPEDLEWTDSEIADIKQLISNNETPENMIVARGVQPYPGFDPEALKAGDTFADPAFLSTSSDLAQAENFAAGRGRDGAVPGWLFVTTVPKGTNYVHGADYQNELIFPAGAQQTVLGVDPEKRTIYTRLEAAGDPVVASAADVAASPGEPIGEWVGVLTTEDEWTGDRRRFNAGSLRWEPDSPAGMPLRWAPEDFGGHQGARHVGWILEAQRNGETTDDIEARGTYFDQEFGEYLKKAGKVGVSVDVDDEVFDVIAAPGAEPLDPADPSTVPVAQDFSSGRIRGATAVDLPAFITGYLEPVEADEALTAAQPGGQFIPGGGRAPGKGEKAKPAKEKAKPEPEKMTKREREKALVEAILSALKDVLRQLSNAQAKALIEQIEDRAHAFIEGQDKSSKRGGGGGGGKSSSGSKDKSSGGSDDSGDKGKGKSSGSSDRLPAGAEGIIEGVKKLIRSQGENMKPGTRKKLERAVNRLDKFALTAAASPVSETDQELTDKIVSLMTERSPVDQDEHDELTHAGVLLRADDTGRWLMLQRALDEDDENGGLWEFPGGGIEDDENPLEAAGREFAEEVGVSLPPSARVLGGVDHGIYRLVVMATDEETDLDIDGREVVNPDDPDGDLTEAVAWWDPEHIKVGGYHIRPEVADSDWDAIESVLSGESDEEGPEDPEDPEEFARLESMFNDFAGNAERLRQYWTTGPGGAKIRWNTPGDFTRCVRQVRKYMPGRAEGYCASLHKRATGKWPTETGAVTNEFNEETEMTTDTDFLTEGAEPFADDAPGKARRDAAEDIADILSMPDLDPAVAEHLRMALEVLSDGGDSPTEEDTLIASAAPVAPPDEWFEPPAEVTGPTPLTVTADGRVSGHLATWNSCHRSEGFARRGQCVQPPSDPDAPMFHLGQVITASGKSVDVGRITVGGGHADIRGNISAALEHYDDASTVVAAVRVVEDEHGIGLYGSVVPEATPAQIAALRRAPLSGDWRKERGKRRLVAAHAVVVPGFPVSRGLVASVSPEAFITRGRVEACSECGEERPATPALVASAFRESVRSDFSGLRQEMRENLSESLRSLRTSITE